MLGHSTMVFCDMCGQAIADQTVKETLYQLPKSRYRMELCPHCLDNELRRFPAHRGIPGFRKRAAVLFTLASEDELPRPAAVVTS